MSVNVLVWARLTCIWCARDNYGASIVASWVEASNNSASTTLDNDIYDRDYVERLWYKYSDSSAASINCVVPPSDTVANNGFVNKYTSVEWAGLVEYSYK